MIPFGMNLNAIWHFFASFASLELLVGLCATAVAITLPPIIAKLIPNLRTVAILTAVGAFVLYVQAGREYSAGIAVKQGEWDIEREHARKASVEQDAINAKKSADQDAHDTAVENATDAVSAEDRKAYVKDLEKRAAGERRLDDAATRRLQDIR